MAPAGQRSLLQSCAGSTAFTGSLPSPVTGTLLTQGYQSSGATSTCPSSVNAQHSAFWGCFCFTSAGVSFAAGFTTSSLWGCSGSANGATITFTNGVSDAYYELSSGVCTAGGIPQASPPPPPPSPPPPPIASWAKADAGEVVALDLPYALYAANQMMYREAFVKAFAAVEGRQTAAVTVTSFQPSARGTVLLHFDTLLDGGDYLAVPHFFASVQALFNCSGDGTVVRGSPACPLLLAALNAAGLPCARAYYNDQLVASVYVSPPPGAVPLNASRVGTWRHGDGGEVVALGILYATFAAHQQSYKAAFIAGMAAALNVSTESVWVEDFQPSAAGTVLLYFDVLDSATSSSAITATFVNITTLFPACRGSGGSLVGCPAGPFLVGKLQQFGLPLTAAYYNQQPAASPPPSPPPPVPRTYTASAQGVNCNTYATLSLPANMTGVSGGCAQSVALCEAACDATAGCTGFKWAYFMNVVPPPGAGWSWCMPMSSFSNCAYTGDIWMIYTANS